ncbi:hypothetical protein JHW45_08505 [Paracoccus stylophorae]|uniref:Uncharacterized protein n=1 Tax=Paracoccus stylophorae TaxID=659350 RepID=A0ABY7SZM5_9RHOB|nr:hypothetical protein [Paracoccus stylophorae]WCR12333.1 hypothetical protein JHW45_08505 [Paracoccus stylophorae]
MPEQIRFLADLVLGLPLWLMGLVVYFLGVARLLSAASTRMHAADHD